MSTRHRTWPNLTKLPALTYATDDMDNIKAKINHEKQKLSTDSLMASTPLAVASIVRPGSQSVAAPHQAQSTSQTPSVARASRGKSAGNTSGLDEISSIPTQNEDATALIEEPAMLDEESSRRLELARKLQEVFGLPSAETVLAEYPSWLFRTVLLQGFLYITEGHLCFYAYIKGKEGQVLRSGSMYRRFPKSLIQTKYWFILKDDVLSWYSSSTNPYFPIEHVSLHYVTSIEPSTTRADRFTITTPTRVYKFATESAKSQEEWIKILRKVAFRSQSAQDSIKVCRKVSFIGRMCGVD